MAYLYAGAAPYAGDTSGRATGGLYRRELAAEGVWERLAGGLPAKLEVHCVELDPRNPDIVYAGASPGLYRSDDGGDHWRLLPLPEHGSVWSILVLDGDPATLYAGTAPHAVFQSRDGGESWRVLPIVDPGGLVDMGFPCRLIRMTVNPADANEIYAGIEVGGLIRSADGGESWEDCSADLLRLAQQDHLKSRILSDTETEGMVDIHALAMAAGSPRLFMANRMGLFRSDDRGDSWEEMAIARFSPLSYARDVVVSPHDPAVLYAAFSDQAVGTQGSLYRSQDGGGSWARFDHGMDFASTLMKISASRADANRIACAARKGQVLATDDGGENWLDLSLPDGVRDVYALACA